MTHAQSRHLLHRLVVFSNHIGNAPMPLLFLGILAFAGAATWAWFSRAPVPSVAAIIGGGLLVFMIDDWVMLAWLPRLRRSFGPVGLTLWALAAIRAAWTAGVLLIPGGAVQALTLAAAGNMAITVAALYGFWHEPFQLGVTRFVVRSPKLAGLPPVRLLHLSDLHIERITEREERLLETIQMLMPDLIVYTGDFLNLSYIHDPRAQADCRQFLSKLQAPLGVYAITGSPSVDQPEAVQQVLAGLSNVTRLDNELAVAQQAENGKPEIVIAGITCTHNHVKDGQTFRQTIQTLPTTPHTPFTLLLYHSPDLMPQAAQAGVDLYLCGHTHGGQIRLPIWGAVVTSSYFYKKYEMGHYKEKDTVLYVSRGIGLEGMGAPRARFLCPPEIELIELSGSGK